MLNSVFANSYLVMVVLVFVAVLLLLESLYVAWQAHRGPEAMKIKARLHTLAATRAGISQDALLRQRMLSELPPLERFLQSVPRLRRLEPLILQAGLEWRVSTLVFGCLALSGAGWIGIVMLAHQPWLAGIAGAAFLGSMPALYVYYKRKQRLAAFERQLPDALDLITRSLRAGHAFSAALKMAGEEMSEPIAGEFSAVHDEVNFGVSLNQALAHLSERVPMTDLRFFVVAVLIQRESGGNLTEILANLSRLIRERLKLMGKVRVLSSEGRLSAWILGLMPFFLAGVMYLVNPQFMGPLFADPMGITIIKYTLGLMAIGVVIMRQIIKIRY